MDNENIKEILDRVKNLKSKCNFCLKIGKNMYIPRHDKQTDNLIEAICLINDMVDYITNFQEEYEKEAYLVDKLTRQLNDEYKNTEYQCKQKEDYKSRNEKAIELLKEAGCYDEETKTFCDDVWEELPELLNILQGSDKDE